MSAWSEVERTLSRCRFFAEARVWPFHARIHPEAWLDNFNEDELPHAVALLESFLFYSPEMVNAMLVSVLQALGPEIVDPSLSTADFRAAWNDFIHTTVFTHVAGERPNSSDSGHSFVRKLRQELGVPESRLFYHPEALRELERADVYVVFVDDFVGSGQQFLYTWRSKVDVGGGTFRSFQDVADPSKTLYCPLICTTKGRQRIADFADDKVRVRAAHVIPPEYGALHADSVLWPDHLRADALQFLDAASQRAGIPASDRYGFDELALAIGFDHSVPDATLTLIYWEENGWNPLVVRA